MTLRCHLFGHVRSASRAAFDEKHQFWISDCKRCHILLVREQDGKWAPLPRQPDRLDPIQRIEPVIADDTLELSEEDEPAAFAAAVVA
ncbi:hypothetical protein GCM10022276_15320 [Sphingomonas limnosediminicola]|jgi:hypothetical protein|uniref:Uncharacterized protein n=1 Tax=Sphingomonas limnosediminicola TaxID=940133 RepID=A0ABP7LCZ9_9SPHN